MKILSFVVKAITFRDKLFVLENYGNFLAQLLAEYDKYLKNHFEHGKNALFIIGDIIREKISSEY